MPSFTTRLSFGSAEAANARGSPSIKMKKSGRKAESWRRINHSPGSSSVSHYAVSLAVGLNEHNETGERQGTKINKSSVIIVRVNTSR
jgi:hypothetical protein